MNLLAILLIVLTPGAELSAGKADYRAGEFARAAAHFQRAAAANPQNAEANYWLGLSYETLADIATPFGRKFRTLARTHLSAAVSAAPTQPEYRRELFEFLLDSGDLRRARAVLEPAESDADYVFMISQLEERGRLNASARGRLTRLLALPTSWR